MQLLQIVILIYCLSYIDGVQWCRRNIYEASFRNPNEELQVLIVLFPVQTGKHAIMQLCSNSTGLPIEKYCNYNADGIDGWWEMSYHNRVFLNCSTIGNKCLDEGFEHVYMMKNKVKQFNKNMWPTAKLGDLAKPQEPCLLGTGLPLTRRCIFNSERYTAVWEDQDVRHVTCLRDINQAIVTYDLNELYQQVRKNQTTNTTETMSAATTLNQILSQPKTLRIPADLEIATNILEIITQNDKEPSLLPKVLEATNILMNSNENIILSSNKMGTPTALIKTIDTYLDDMTNLMLPTTRCADVPNGVRHSFQNLTSVFYINPVCSNVSGIAVYSSSIHPTPIMRYDNYTKTYYRYLYLNETLETLMSDSHLEVAAYFPETVWRALANETAGKIERTAVRISLYKNGNFFIDQFNIERTPASVVLKISVPDYKADLPADIPLIFQHRPETSKQKPKCANWNYKEWHTSGSAIVNQQNLIVCNTRQLTNFGAILRLDYKGRLIANSVLLTVMVEFALDIISIAGCGLSLCGLICIWLTAACCQQWRAQSSNKLLLNLCFVLTLIMGYFLFINVPTLRNDIVDIENPKHCIAEGAFLQYIILVLFLWMLFVAVLQYQRYVTVLGYERPRHFIAKYALASWGLPIIPIVLVICLDSKSYMPFAKETKNNNAICYPSGGSLYYALLLPISIIVLVNIGIFAYILSSIHRSRNQFKSLHSRQDILKQVRLSILLFFLLGLSWVFGILAHMDTSRVLSLLFCLTSTLQGFILFIYFVVIDKSAHYSWFKCLYIRTNDSTTESTSTSPMEASS